jgi:hypothetical protein
MKSLLLNVVAVLLLVPAVAVAQPVSLRCTAELLQGTKVLAPRTKSGRQFAEFSFDLDRDPNEAWEHQNMCISKRDFQGASFEGSLCVVLMTTRESADVDAPTALLVGVSRISISSSPRHLSPERSGSLGGMSAVVPLDRQGKHFGYTQFFANKGGKSELSSLRMECNP